MIVIMNLRDSKPDPNCIWQVKVDRSSVLGNPFIMKTENHRKQVCDKYETMFDTIVDATDDNQEFALEHVHAFRGELLRLTRIYGHEDKLELYCWCSPKRCHSEAIRDYIIAQVGKSKPDTFQSEE